ncbi:MAG: lysophospholipid acyltransferase family protein [Syntrophales bacterium]|nr:lysophospholipid acyltransferase family protein [Syntrophales bacterium]MDD5232023.1 lysophospholipid acyltransferase family protein [Syntrophales bacterium]MDD5532993.1 lysophospholipid acyltransferase family protein [Syntrophales bacterium]
MLRSAFLVCIGLLLTGFISVFITIFYPLFPHGEYTVHRIARFWAKTCLALSGVKVTVEGEENIRRDTPQIVMANHQSWYDIFIMLAYIPIPFSWLAKKELFRIPAFGIAIRRLGVIEIDRKNRPDAVKSLDSAAVRIKGGKSVVTFPEGTRSMDTSVQPFKKGVFHLALDTGVNVVPAAIVGSHEVMPKRSLRITPGKVWLVIGKPVPVAEYNAGTLENLIARARNEIISKYNETRSCRYDSAR